MNVGYMREKIAKAYDGPRWKERVACMPDNQVIAIFYSFKKKGLFDSISYMKKEIKPEPVQITIWDILREKENADGLLSVEGYH